MKVLGLLILMFLGFNNVGFTQNQETDLMIYDFTEEDAQFPGGNDILQKWIATNFELPSDLTKSEQGKIYLSFVIEKDGSVSNIRIVKGLSDKLNEVAIKVVEKMPKWKPAINNGKPVRSRYTLPISVVL
jgi:protein TonB